MKKVVFIAWTRYQRRSEVLAQKLNATMHHIYWGQQGNLIQIPIRYLVQAWKTRKILHRECPDVIFVQNPPIFSVLLAFLYTRRHKAQYIIDSHTGAFLSWKWRWSLAWLRLLSRKALLIIVHNKSQEKIVKQWDCRYCVLPDLLKEDLRGVSFPVNGNLNVAVVGSFSEDEPTETVFEAARQLTDVHFYFTGDPVRLKSRLQKHTPINCQLTGYLTDEKYVGLLQASDCIMVLTTRNDTLLSGAFEAVSLGKPLILSDWPILRDYFHLGTVHIPNTMEGIIKGITYFQHNQATLQQDIFLLKEHLQKESALKLAELEKILYEPYP